MPAESPGRPSLRSLHQGAHSMPALPHYLLIIPCQHKDMGLPRMIGHQLRIFRTVGKQTHTRCAGLAKASSGNKRYGLASPIRNEFHAPFSTQRFAYLRYPSLDRASHHHRQPPRTFQNLRHRIKFMFHAGPEQCPSSTWPIHHLPSLAVDAPACEIAG